jgi:hypothetical protein
MARMANLSTPASQPTLDAALKGTEKRTVSTSVTWSPVTSPKWDVTEMFGDVTEVVW